MNAKKSPGQVEELLGLVRDRARRAAAVATILWASVAIGAVMGLSWILGGPEGWRQGSIGPLLLVLSGVVILAVGAFVVHIRVMRWLSDRTVASVVERRAGLDEGLVMGSLELERSIPVGVSPSLSVRAREKVLVSVQAKPDELAQVLVGRAKEWARPALRLLVGFTILLLAASTLSPDRTWSAIGGLFRPLHLLAKPVLPPLRVFPGDASVPRGERVEILVVAGPRETVTFHWQARGDVAREATLEVLADSARLELPPVDATVEYWVEAPDGARTSTFRIDPSDPLFVGSVAIELVFPAYTGRFREELRGDLPELVVPQGTVFEIRGEANRPLQDVRLIGEDESEFQIPLSADGFQGRFTPPYGGVWRWRILGTDGSVPGRPPTPLVISVTPDALPEIEFTFPARDTVLPLNLRQQLELQAQDDYGLREVRLVAWRIGAVGDAATPVVQQWAAEGTRGTLLRPLLDFSDWGLLPGDSVAYRAETLEVGPFGKEAVTRDWILRVPDANELRSDAAERLDQASERIDSLIQEAARLADELRDREMQAAAEERRAEAQRTAAAEETEGAFERREEMAEALDRQEEILAATDSLRSELDQMAEALQDAGVSDPSLRKDLEELENLLAEVGDDGMRERLKELRSEIADMDPAAVHDALEQMVQDQERMQERLEESLEQFQRAAVEQDFRATHEEARTLATEERRLSEAAEQGADPEMMAARQENAAERADALEKRMEQLAERLEALGEERTGEQIREVKDAVKRSSQAMQRSADAARSSDQQGAAEEAQEAAEEMDDAAKELEQARQEMEQARQDAFEEAAGRAAEDALALARRQADLRDLMGVALDPQLRADEGALLSGLTRLAENLSVAAGAAGADPRPLLQEVGRAMDRIDAVVGTLDGPPSQRMNARAGADAAVEALNGIALTALEMADGASSGSDQGESEGEISEELQRAADQQAQVTRETQQAMSMQMQNQAQGTEMREVAEAQRRIAGDLGKMADEPGSADQVLGDLPALAEAARQLAEELESGRLQPETVERQRELFHRLLDAGRSLEKDEESEEREANGAGDFERSSVSALGENALGAYRFAPPSAEVLRRIPPAQRYLILEYFDRLNRSKIGGGG